MIASLNNATGFYVTDWEDDQPSTDPDDKKFATESRKIREAALEINSLGQLFVQQWVNTLTGALADAQLNPDTTIDDLTTAIVDATTDTENNILDTYSNFTDPNNGFS